MEHSSQTQRQVVRQRAHSVEEILRDWFSDPARWWKSDPAFDQYLGRTYRADVEAAMRGELDAWSATTRGALALVILLDQLTRNIYRGTRRMYAGDDKAVAICLQVIDRDEDQSLSCR